MKRVALLFCGSAAVFAAMLYGCDYSPTDCDSRRTCAEPSVPDGSEGGADTGAGADVGVVPPGCDPTAEPKDAPKCVVNEMAVFVDGANGDEANPGTREAPVKSIGTALAKLGGKSRVYVCEGTYAEHVKLTSAVSIYGGFACGAWTSGGKTKVAPPDTGYALSVLGATDPVVIADLSMAVVDSAAGAPGQSSVGAFVAKSAGVTFRRVDIAAGRGFAGNDGAAVALFTGRAPDGTSGAAGGTETKNPECPTSVGGAGGSDATTANGSPGKVSVNPSYPADSTGNGGVSGGTCGTGIGADGSEGIAGTKGDGAATVGSIAAEGWKANDGAPGGRGTDGQGGGGGAKRLAGGIGGSGGAGGCAGAGGGQGQAGGSSIALLVYESPVVLESVSLTTKDAGNGGKGGQGQVGQLGSNGQAGGTGGGCPGGLGGAGGSGGGGGGGAGGVSVGLLYKGPAPKVDGTSIPNADGLPSVVLGQAGKAGQGGAGGGPAQPADAVRLAGAAGTGGVDGFARAVMGL